MCCRPWNNSYTNVEFTVVYNLTTEEIKGIDDELQQNKSWLEINVPPRYKLDMKLFHECRAHGHRKLQDPVWLSQMYDDYTFNLASSELSIRSTGMNKHITHIYIHIHIDLTINSVM